jgi:GT2 family glycosyltransferase
VNVFVGVVTVPDRSSYLDQVKAALKEHVEPLGVELGVQVDRHGHVAKAKNVLLRAGLQSRKDWILISEDDVVVQSPRAVTGYLDAAIESGWGHLAFAHHGPANARGPIEKGRWVSLYPHYVGAWCLYSRRSLQVCGLLDEHFVNSWDHVEHTLRLSEGGFHPTIQEPYELRAADATGSEAWIKEIPGSIESTAIPHTPQWRADRERGRIYWRETYPETYFQVFGR